MYFEFDGEISTDTFDILEQMHKQIVLTNYSINEELITSVALILSEFSKLSVFK